MLKPALNSPGREPNPDSSRSNNTGNVMVMGVMVMMLLTMFGAVMTSRMVVDSNAAARRINSARAFYLADGGIQWGRKYLANGNSAATTLGPTNVGLGTVTVQIIRDDIYYPDAWSNEDVYIIRSTATVGQATRRIEEYRWRGGGSDKDFGFWREAIVDEVL